MDTHLINCHDSANICSSAPVQHTEEDLPIIGTGFGATAPALASNSGLNPMPVSTSAAASAPASTPRASVSAATPVPHAPVAPESSQGLASGHLGSDPEQILRVGSPADEDAGVMPIPDFDSSSASTPAPNVEPIVSRPKTRLQRGIHKPKIYTDGTIKYGFLATSGEPRNLDEALQNSNWKEAMQAEYLALMKNKTWHLVPPQRGTNIIDCK
jgi:hypothetical protein